MKRPNPQTLEMDVTDTILELRLANTAQRHRISGAAILLWNTWKRTPNFEMGVAAVVKKYRIDETRVRADAEKLLADLDAAGLLLE